MKSVLILAAMLITATNAQGFRKVECKFLRDDGCFRDFGCYDTAVVTPNSITLTYHKHNGIRLKTIRASGKAWTGVTGPGDSLPIILGKFGKDSPMINPELSHLVDEVPMAREYEVRIETYRFILNGDDLIPGELRFGDDLETRRMTCNPPLN